MGVGVGVYRPHSFDNLQNGKSQQQHQKCSIQTLLPSTTTTMTTTTKQITTRTTTTTTSTTTTQQQQQKMLRTHNHYHHHHHFPLHHLTTKQQQQQQPQHFLDTQSDNATPQRMHSPASSSHHRLQLKRSLHLPLSPLYDARHSPIPLLQHHHAQQQQQHQQQQQQQHHRLPPRAGVGQSSISATLAPTPLGSLAALSMTATPTITIHQQHQAAAGGLKRPSTLQLQSSAMPATSSTTVHTIAPQAPAPSDYKYYSPQRSTESMFLRNFPVYKTRGVRRQSTQSVESQKVNIAGYQPLPMRQRYKHQEVLFELKSPTNRLTIRECDFGGGGEPCDDDQSIKDSQIFRVSKRNLYMNHRSPWKERDRYSNLYEYSFNIDLNSIIEDAAGSDSS